MSKPQIKIRKYFPEELARYPNPYKCSHVEAKDYRSTREINLSDLSNYEEYCISCGSIFYYEDNKLVEYTHPAALDPETIQEIEEFESSPMP